MSAKAKGTRNEHKTCRYLEQRGYQCVRGAASMGVFDVWAVNSKEVLFVQVKTNRWAGLPERRAMWAWHKQIPPNGSIELWRWDDYKREPRIIKGKKLIERF